MPKISYLKLLLVSVFVTKGISNIYIYMKESDGSLMYSKSIKVQLYIHSYLFIM